MSVDLRNSLFMTNSLVILDWTYPLDLPLSLGHALIPWTCPFRVNSGKGAQDLKSQHFIMI